MGLQNSTKAMRWGLFAIGKLLPGDHIMQIWWINHCWITTLTALLEDNENLEVVPTYLKGEVMEACVREHISSYISLFFSSFFLLLLPSLYPLCWLPLVKQLFSFFSSLNYKFASGPKQWSQVITDGNFWNWSKIKSFLF